MDPWGLIAVTGHVTVINVGVGVAGIQVTINSDGSISITGNVGPFGGTVTVSGEGSGDSGLTAPTGSGPGSGIGGWM